MNPNYIDIDYLNTDADHKDFIQRMVFLEYVEEWKQAKFKEDVHIALEKQLLWELAHYEYHEDYETCQLIKDILIRYKTDLIQFDN